MTTISARVLWTIFVCLAIALGTFYSVAAAHLFPAMNIDAASHLVPILNYKAGHGFGSAVWSLTRDYDPTGQHRFLQYPPLFHLTVASLIRHPDAADIYRCLGVFVVIALGLYAALIVQRPVAGPARSQPRWIALACVSLPAISTWLYQLPSSGRPEALAAPLVIFAVLALLRAPVRWQPLVAGGCIGLLGAMQPAAAILAGLLYSVYVSLQPTGGPGPAGSTYPRQPDAVPSNRMARTRARTRIKPWLGPVVTAAVVALATFAACFLWSPYSLPETLRGMAYHAARLPKGDLSVVNYYILPAGTGTFYGLFYLVLLAHYVWWHGRAFPWLGAVNLGVFVVAAWALAVYHPNRCYNLLPFTAVFLAVGLALVARLEASDATATRGTTPFQRTGIYAVYFAVFTLMSIGMMRQAVLYAIYTKNGVGYAEAKSAFQARFPANDQTPILFDSGLFALLDHFDHTYQRFHERFDPLDPVPEPTRPVLLVHQWYGRLASPPQIPGYRLVWDDFAARPPPRFLGLKVASAMPGYAFAVYQPVSP